MIIKIINEQTPLVSIVVPAYNAERFIMSTLNSLISQTFKNIEIIVVNDGSTDGTENCIKMFSFDRRLRYVKKENGGTGSALNVGHKLARGKFVTWCSSDNIYFPNFVAELANALLECEHRKIPCQFVYSDFAYIDANNNHIKDLIHDKPQPREDMVNGYDLGMSFMYTKELWERTGLFWDRICEDYHWAVRAAQFTNFGLIKGVLAAYRVHEHQMSVKALEAAAANIAIKDLANQLMRAGAYGPVETKFAPVLVED